MPVYHYKARDRAGKLATGHVETFTRDAAGEKIESMGYIPVSIIEENPKPSGMLTGIDLFGGKIKAEEMIMLFFQLSTLLGAGIPLLSALKTLSKQIKNKKLSNIIEQSCWDIEGGGTLSESLAKHPKIFPETYANMIHAGEASGKLQEIFVRLGEMTEHEAETRERIEAALRYPKMVVIALLLAFCIVTAFVVPRFVAIFEQFKIAIPLPTRMLIGLNTLFQEYWVPVAVGVVFLIFFVRWLINTSSGRYYWHYLKIKVPVLGPLFQKVALSRFAHIMGTLNHSGLPIIDNLKITATAVGNDVISKAITKIRDSIQEGRGIAEPMKDIDLFTPLVVQMISVGETTGELDDVLLKVSRYYDMEVEYGTKHLSTYLEPVLTLTLGVMVLFFALAIFLPMWDMTKIAGG